jgi:hypothetical protein
VPLASQFSHVLFQSTEILGCILEQALDVGHLIRLFRGQALKIRSELLCPLQVVPDRIILA